MINQLTDSFGYRGVVTLKLLRGDRVVRTIQTHNEGSTALFRIIVSMLCGNNESINLPQYLDAITANNASGILNRITLTGIKTDVNSATPCAYFSALIPANQFLQGNSIIRLGLYNTYTGNSSDYLAQVSLTQEQIDVLSNFTSLDPGVRKLYITYNLLIEWRMYISNGDVTRLATPSVSITSGTASWSAITNATSYNVLLTRDGTSTLTNQSTLTCSVATGDIIQVQAISEDTKYIDSGWSTSRTA